MDSEKLQEQSCHKQIKKIHNFGPYTSLGQLAAKQIEDESKKNLTVSFKQKDDIIIVENWKKYNIDVSNPSFQIQKNHKSNTGCWNVCVSF
ncbi:unnamed protein product [Paramecium sonneborni]|uniref:Uncharacterized protein n=1 Tax=Paramecium sonneborni TaxID=65129 RepID=A0A8S1P6C3_9CILI|nr:unnamed protein product [Paramecium sonneborni]